MKQRPVYSLRFWIVAMLLTGAAASLQTRQKREFVPKSEPLKSFPIQAGNWTGRDLRIDDETLRVLGPGDFLSRKYTAPGQPYVEFFLGFFPSQRSGDTMHSPKNCIPGAGWAPVESSRIMLTLPAAKKIQANRYIIQKGLDRQLVIYWYQAHGRTVASEYWAKFYLLKDAIRLNRSDGGIVRIITPILDSEDRDSAERRAVSFAAEIAPDLDKYIPS